MRILIVDDEPLIRDLLTTALKSEGFVVDTAEDGERGASLARQNPYDIIVLDNRLPKKSGIEVCREIRAQGAIVPILMLSVLDDPRHKADLLNAGADDYMSKPYSYEELVARIRALLRRASSLSEDVLTVGPLMLDSKRHIVLMDQQEINLTRKEFALLEHLMRNKDAVLTRGMIMEHVWDMNADPFSNTIESHIASLRKKLRAHGHDALIRTVPGYGYRIMSDSSSSFPS